MTAEHTYPIADSPDHANKGITVRSLIFGLVLVVTISALATVVRYILHSSFMAYSHMPMGNLMLTLLCLIVCSVLARWFGKRFAFSSSEWLVIFSMGFISSLGPTYGVSGYLVGVIVTPYYFSTPENRWAEFLHPYLPEWIIPSNRDGAMTMVLRRLACGCARTLVRLARSPLLVVHLYLCHSTGLLLRLGHHAKTVGGIRKAGLSRDGTHCRTDHTARYRTNLFARVYAGADVLDRIWRGGHHIYVEYHRVVSSRAAKISNRRRHLGAHWPKLSAAVGVREHCGNMFLVFCKLGSTAQPVAL